MRRTAEALARLQETLADTYFDEAVAVIRKAEAEGGRVHVTGVGKSRHIGRKLAATLQSTGTKAYFLDPADCNHGDSGQVAEGDVVVALSHSGETEELMAAVRTLVANGATIVAITGDAASSLARSSAAVLHVPVEGEAGPLGLAPTVQALPVNWRWRTGSPWRSRPAAVLRGKTSPGITPGGGSLGTEEIIGSGKERTP